MLAILVAILAVSTASIFIRFAQEKAPSLVIAAYRLGLATLVLAPVTLSRHRAEVKQALSQKKVAWLGVLSGVLLAFHFATWITSLQYTSVASSVVLVTTSPLWVALFSPLILKEPLPWYVWVGLVVTLLGGMVVGISDSCQWSAGGILCPSLTTFLEGKAFLGDILAFMGAFFASGYILIGRRLRPTMSLNAYTFLVYGVAALVLLGVVALSGESLVGYPWQTYLFLLALALVPQLIGHSTFNWALRYLSAAYVSIALLGEPLGSTVLAYFVLSEIPSPFKLAGLGLILAGILVASLQGNKRLKTRRRNHE
jgi:drug/metabolite transporter (DMT)-like permease